MAIPILAVLLNFALAAPPHPQLLKAIESGNSEPTFFLEHFDELHQKGVCSAERFVEKDFFAKIGQKSSTDFRVLAILVKFPDQNNSVPAVYFDSLVFDTLGSSVRDYFLEVSYSQIDLVTVNLPSSVGWQTAPQNYSYYVNDNNGLGAYPQNSQKMVEDVVDQIDSLVDFSVYDNDMNGFVDVLLVIHSGPGGEFTGSNDDIWSHKWGITPRLKDGVFISSYTAQPEYWVNPGGDMTIGIYAHELCHGFGLPDLFDLDNSSNGIGKWGIMGIGGWNGVYPGGSSPAHPCAWSRIEMGFAIPSNVTSILNNVAIEDVKSGGEIYRLWNCGEGNNEYFLIENRQKSAYDTFLPGSGLLIWHIDDNKTTNTQEWWPGQSPQNHYKVALIQADGQFELEWDVDNGDISDPYPGPTNNSSFDALSTPNSDSYTLEPSNVSVKNISLSGEVIYVDMSSGSFTDEDSNGVGDACTSCCSGYRGDLNGDGTDADMMDLVFLVNYLFRFSNNPGPCLIESDINYDGYGPNTLDLNALVDFLFRFGDSPPNCFY